MDVPIEEYEKYFQRLFISACIQTKGEYFEGQGRIKGSKINKCGG